MNFKIHILLFGLLLFQLGLVAQTADSILQKEAPIPFGSSLEIVDTTDSQASLTEDSTATPTKKKRFAFVKNIFSKADYPNPKKALYLSLAIPGAGQNYNKRWWKLPFVYGGYAALIYAVDYNTKGYKNFRDVYIAELADQEHQYTHLGLNANDFRRLRDRYDKNRQLSYIGIFALHIIQTAEAFVDCHLKSFDVSDDLSMQVGPKMGMTGDGSSFVGVGLRFSLNN
jgi:hypothetical protein